MATDQGSPNRKRCACGGRGAAGLLLAFLFVKALPAILPAGSMPREQEIGMHPAALLFTAALSMLTGLVSGFLPAWHASRGDVNDALKQGGRGGLEGRSSHRTRGLLVATETALAFVLLIGAGLMLRSFAALLMLDPGFDPHHLLTTQISVAGSREADAPRRALFYQEVTRRLASIPGVRSVSAINHLPISGDTWGTLFQVEGKPTPAPGEEPHAVYRIVQPNYFATMRTSILLGRDFSEADSGASPPVVILNQSAAHRYWPRENPAGKRIMQFSPKQGDPKWLTVVGVVQDVKQSDWQSVPREEIYFPFSQSKEYTSDPGSHFAYMSFVIRTARNPASLESAVQTSIHSIDPGVLVSKTATMESSVSNSLWRPRITLILLSLFGLTALVLAATGIYAVTSHAMSERTQEMGIRMALGARPGDVVRLGVGQEMIPVTIGITAGLLLAVGLSKLLSILLFEIRAVDLATYSGVSLVMLATGLLGAYTPVRRASCLDPVIALLRQ